MKQFDLAKLIDTLYQIEMGNALRAIIFCTMTSYILTSNVWNLDVCSVLSFCRRKKNCSFDQDVFVEMTSAKFVRLLLLLSYATKN